MKYGVEYLAKEHKLYPDMGCGVAEGVCLGEMHRGIYTSEVSCLMVRPEVGGDGLERGLGQSDRSW
jgi:hypothetical protein